MSLIVNGKDVGTQIYEETPESSSWDKVKEFGETVARAARKVDWEGLAEGFLSAVTLNNLGDRVATAFRDRFGSTGEIAFSMYGSSIGKVIKLPPEIRSYVEPDIFFSPDLTKVAFDGAAHTYKKTVENAVLFQPVTVINLETGDHQSYGYVQTGEFIRVEEKTTEVSYRNASFPHSIFSDIERCETSTVTVVERTQLPDDSDPLLNANIKVTERCRAVPY